MKLICYPTSGEAPKLVPAPLERDWMDATTKQFAYRCLPLNIANAHGWFVLNEAPVNAMWDGRPGIEAVQVEVDRNDGRSAHAVSHFGHGVLTFHVRGLFRTEPGYDLYVCGPTNHPKDGIQPLAGIVETDWSPFTFTMNWRFTRANERVRFYANEPVCMIFPVKRGMVEAVEPEIRDLQSDDPELYKQFMDWAHGRTNFNKELEVEGSEAQRQKWQKEYFRGESGAGAGADDHRTKLKLKPFTDVRGKP